MIESNGDTIDIVKELRLRQWGRLHYVPPAERSASWHPVVLDEMSLRDAELQSAVSPETTHPARSFVPLPPARYHAIHASHPDVTEPNLVKNRALPAGATRTPLTSPSIDASGSINRQSAD